MKTTSFLVSKKLAEIGFYKPEEATGTHCHVDQEETFIGFVPVSDERIFHYGLETILEALPLFIGYKEGGPPICFSMSRFGAAYKQWDEEKREYETKFEVINRDKESLADTAARLLIKLVEAGIVKFGEKNDA